MSKNLLYTGALAAALTTFYPSQGLTQGTSIGDPWKATVKTAAVCYQKSCPVFIHVDGRRQILDLYLDGVLNDSWRVSTGLHSPTPNYDGKPIGWNPRIHTSKENPGAGWRDPKTGIDMGNMPYSIFFTNNGHALHGTPTVAYLGWRASHGCVRQDPEKAQKLWKIVNRYDRLQVHITIIDADSPDRIPAAARKSVPLPYSTLPPRKIEPPVKRGGPDVFDQLFGRN